MKEKTRVHFSSRKRSIRGLLGFYLSLTGVLLMMVLILISVLKNGQAGIAVGFIGLLLAVLCGASFTLSLQGLKEKDVYTKLPFIGMILSGLIFVLLFCLYISGIQW